MKILVLGGTVFLGRHVVEAALARGHDVTICNRGRQNPHLFPGIEKLRGDRDSELAALRGRTFDAVVDPSAYRPEQVHAVAAALGATGHYTFISSMSVYERGMLHADNRRAVATGLTFRPVAETIRATLEWDCRDGGPPSSSSIRVTPITFNRERELLTGRAQPAGRDRTSGRTGATDQVKKVCSDRINTNEALLQTAWALGEITTCSTV